MEYVKSITELVKEAQKEFRKDDVLTGHQLKKATEINMGRINDLENEFRDKIQKLEERIEKIENAN